MFAIPTKGRYSVRILARIAFRQNKNNNFVQKKDIATEENISEDYTEQLLMHLKSAGIIESRRGPTGGFSLTRPANTISILEILQAVEGNIAVTPCISNSCIQYKNCSAKNLWFALQNAIINILKNTKLSDIAAEINKAESEPLDYAI